MGLDRDSWLLQLRPTLPLRLHHERNTPTQEAKSLSATALGAVTTDKTSSRLHRPCTLMLCRAKNTGLGWEGGEVGEGALRCSGSLLISRAS